jgi:hypothetical protein
MIDEKQATCCSGGLERDAAPDTSIFDDTWPLHPAHRPNRALDRLPAPPLPFLAFSRDLLPPLQKPIHNQISVSEKGREGAGATLHAGPLYSSLT